MFFELVTAELVVADISALNVNVFYELGVRSGVCPRGVFLVRGNWEWSRPFDIASDRSFTYNGKYFEKGSTCDVQEVDIENLAKVLRQAIRTDPLTVGSPVYSHLPGLKPPDITKIQTSRARYFSALQDNWVELVHLAQSKGHAGHIVTLAEEAPSPVHRVQILYEASKALIGLCRYKAAQRILNQLLVIEPSHANARIQLAIVLDQLGLDLEAEDEMRKVLLTGKDDPNASDLLGQVYRQLWRLSWKDNSDSKDGRPFTCSASGQAGIIRRAQQNYALAASAFQHFWAAQEAHPEAYFSGFNAVVLRALIDHLFSSGAANEQAGGETNGKTNSDLHRPAEFGVLPLEKMIPVVKFSAECAHRRAAAVGDHDQRFWTTTCLSGLALLEPGGPSGDSLQLIYSACAFPQATLFHMESLKQRLLLLKDLNFECNFATEAIGVVDEAICRKQLRSNCQKVIVYHGYPVDPNSSSRRFPPETIDAVRMEIRKVLEKWKVDKGDLALVGGIREGDLVFVGECLQRGARVQILLLEPSPMDTVRTLWPSGSAEWADSLHDLANHHPNVSIWRHEEELGRPLNPSEAESRHNRWLMNTARLAAEGDPESRLYGIVLLNDTDKPKDTDKQKDIDDPEYAVQADYFIGGIRSALCYQGQVEIIDPLKLGTTQMTKSVAIGGS